MQRPFFVLRVDQYGQAAVAGSVGNILIGTPRTHSKTRAARTRVAVFHASHDANDRVAALDFDRTQRAQVANDLVDVAVVVDGQRDGDFRRGDHVDRSSVLLENFEHLAQKTVCHQHARRVDADDRDAVFGRDGVERLVSSSPVRYRRAGSLGVHRVLKQHGYPVILAGLNRGRMQDFRTEISQLGRLVETHRPDRTGVVDETGIVVVPCRRCRSISVPRPPRRPLPSAPRCNRSPLCRDCRSGPASQGTNETLSERKTCCRHRATRPVPGVRSVSTFSPDP